MKHLLHMQYSKTTPGTYVYAAEDEASSDVCRTLYISKRAMKSGPLKRISVEILDASPGLRPEVAIDSLADLP